MLFRSNIVDEDFFNNHIHSIMETLKEKAPEWEIVVKSTPYFSATDFSATGDGIMTCFHLARWDFSGGRNMTWDIPINCWIFAYYKDGKFYVLNLHPLEYTKKD